MWMGFQSTCSKLFHFWETYLTAKIPATSRNIWSLLFPCSLENTGFTEFQANSETFFYNWDLRTAFLTPLQTYISEKQQQSVSGNFFWESMIFCLLYMFKTSGKKSKLISNRKSQFIETMLREGLLCAPEFSWQISLMSFVYLWNEYNSLNESFHPKFYST